MATNPNPGILRNLRIKRVSLVDMGANFDTNTGDGAHIMLYKRADVKKESPSVAAVHVDTIIGSDKKKKEKDVKKSLLKRILGSFSEPDVTKRATEVAEIQKALDELPDDEGVVVKVHKADDSSCDCEDCMVKRASNDDVAKTVAKAVDDAQKASFAKIAELTSTIEVEKGLRLDREMTDVLKSFKFVPLNMAEDVKKFRKMKETSPAEYDRMIEVLKAADAQLSTSALYRNVGSDLTGGSGDAWSEIQKLAQSMISKGGTGLTIEKAIEQVLLDPANKDLVKRYRAAQ